MSTDDVRPSEELQAKAAIAAALIEARFVGLAMSEQELSQQWSENHQLIRLNRLTNLVYDAIVGKI